MHIYFVGIGGTGIGPLAMIASQAGYDVSGSNDNESEYTHYLQKKGLEVHIDQSGKSMAEVHANRPIDWVVSVSAIVRLNPNHPELIFARENEIKVTERDVFLNEILEQKDLKMVATAGTHGKTTTTAMFVWAFQKLGIPISYSVGAKMSFADMGHYEPGSKFFIYECDEFHRNFLQFYPFVSVISGVAWDHHEVFPTRENYNQAFLEYIDQTGHTILWEEDANYLGIESDDDIEIISSELAAIEETKLPGLYNRRDAWLVVEAIHRITDTPKEVIQTILSDFPGTARRMEEVSPGLFTDYAHTPEKIVGAMSVAAEIAKKRSKSVVVVYEPLTNRRQHFMKADYKNCFKDAKKVYWIPSYLAREDPNQAVLSPEELIKNLDNPNIAESAGMDEKLWKNIQTELKDSIVVCMTGGGGNSLDEWLRGQVRNR